MWQPRFTPQSKQRLAGLLMALLLIATSSQGHSEPLPAAIEKQGIQGHTDNTHQFGPWHSHAPKWKINPNQVNTITFYLDNTPAKGSVHQAVYAQYLNQALEDWSEASRGAFHFVKVSDPALAQIRIDWVNAKQKTAKGITNTPPTQTIFTTDADGDISQAGIFINPKNLPASTVRTLLLREVGVALGLRHNQHLDEAMCAMKTKTDVACIPIRSSLNQKHHYLPQITPEDALALRRLYHIQWQNDRLQGIGQEQSATDPLLQSEIWNKHKYLSTLSEDIRNHWSPGPYRNLPVVVELTLDPYGRLLNNKIITSSNSALADALALRAVEAAAPFAPFPKNYPGKLLKVTFHFKP